ncbi:MAG: transketolase [Thermoplasmata archaeon HGW-Thermoplasmata-1]|nr:MAG: transketolase [Thermoplasmata archaeon HGW-Thermoplasmata-1]
MDGKVRMMSMRDSYSSALIELGRKNHNVIVCDADLALSTKTKRFGMQFPERFFDFGIAEANMMSAAAGMASCGKIVFASSFAAFATGRCYDQIRQSIAYPRLNVKIVATHAGISVGGDGASHQMIEDMAIMRAIPNMTVIAPADGNEAEAVIKAVAEFDGPCYVRMGRADYPVVFDNLDGFRIGKAVTLREGNGITLVSTGVMLSETIKAAEILSCEGIDARVLHVHTLKPIDSDAISKASKETGAIVTVEEHSIIGGLGSAVAEVTSEEAPCRITRVGIRDCFGESGDGNELMKKYGLDADNIVAAAKGLLGAK